MKDNEKPQGLALTGDREVQDPRLQVAHPKDLCHSCLFLIDFFKQNLSKIPAPPSKAKIFFNGQGGNSIIKVRRKEEE